MRGRLVFLICHFFHFFHTFEHPQHGYQPHKSLSMNRATSAVKMDLSPISSLPGNPFFPERARLVGNLLQS